jgi:DNA-damage-inducible protein J
MLLAFLGVSVLCALGVLARSLLERFIIKFITQRNDKKKTKDGNSGSRTQVRTDAEVKAAADSVFRKLGITMTDGINIFLRQVNLHGGFPFDVKLPASEQENQSRLQKREFIHQLCGKYKNSTFSAERYLQQKRRERE